MRNSTNTSSDLRLRIAELENLSFQQEREIKHTAATILKDLKPINLIKGVFNDTVKSPGFGKNLLKGAMGLAAGFVSKKIFVMGSSNIVKKALGTVVELGVAKVVVSNADRITSTGVKLLNKSAKKSTV